jgi:polyisoprenoid-binding protein YceI
MSASGRSHPVGPDRGKLTLRTSRQGLAAQAGHDLTIEVSRWSGEVRVADDAVDSSVEVTVEVGTLRVVEGKGGVKPLSDRDKREIAGTARKLLDTDRQPQATFSSDSVSESAGGGVIKGRLTLRGVERPLELAVTALGEGRYRATGTLAQSEYGIKPYTAFFGALKLADPVDIEAEVDLSESAP